MNANTKRILLTAIAAGLVFAADAPKETVTSLVAQDEDILLLHAAMRVTSLIVLPEQEKALAAFCGDRTYWNVDIMPGAERFIAVKPSKAGIHTDIHIVTDHGHSYTLKAEEMSSGGTVDLKLFIRPANLASLDKPPTLVSAEEANRLREEVTAAQSKAKEAEDQAKTKMKETAEALRIAYPGTMRFDYRFERNKDPFNVTAIWNDANNFTYIRANPRETPALYELKDGKPSLIQYQFEGGLYTIPKLLDSAYLMIGKKRMEILREKPGS